MEVPYRRLLISLLILLVLHQNYWLWDTEGSILGLPVNLLYHLTLCLLVTVALYVLVGRSWPTWYDRD